MARIPLVSEFKPEGIDKAIREFQKLETTGQKVGLALEKAFLPAVAAVGALAAGAVLSAKAAAEDAAQQTELARQLVATTGATQAQIDANEEFIATLEIAAAVADSELRPALANLIRATGDLGVAQDLLGLALDISAGTGRDLEAVSQALGKAYQGQMTALTRLDPSIAAVVRSGADAEEVFTALADTFGGAAAENAETVEGRFRRMQIQMENVQESIGYALLPIIEKLLPTLERLATFVGDNTELVIGLGVAIGGFATAIIAANVAMKAWNILSAITAAVNGALATSFSVLWVATGVGIIIAIIAAVVYLQMKFDIFGKAVDGLTRLFNTLWSVAKYTLEVIIDGINYLIRAWNKLPLVDDIPEISTEFLGLYETTETVAVGIDNVTASAMNAEYEFAELRRQTGLSALQMEQALVPTVDRVSRSFRNATSDLRVFYGELDRDDAVRNFDESMAEISKKLSGLKEGTVAWDTAISEALRTVQTLSEALGNIPPTIERTMLLRIQMGDIEGGLAIADLFNRGMFMEAAVESGSRFATAAGYNPNTSVYGGTTININMPAGSNGQDMIDAINRETRRTGQAQIPVGASVRR